MAQAISLPAALSPEQGLQNYLREIQKFPILEAKEEQSLARDWAERGDYQAAHTLVTSHLRLVAKIAMGFRGYGLPVNELIAEGNIGLMQAVKKFDPEKGFRLSTYAMWWIRASIQEFVLRSWSVVKVGTSAAQKRLFFNLKKLKQRLSHYDDSTDLSPDMVKEIAQELDVNEKDVIDMDRRMIANDRRLNAPIGNGEGGQWMDLLEDDTENQEELYAEFEERDQQRTLLAGALDTLNERERHIIEERRLKDDPMTLEELSKVYHISRERVRQIEARAMEKLTQSVHKAIEHPSLQVLPSPH